MTERYAIIGGGMLGMTLAHRLAALGVNVTLYEASPRLGGLASAWQLGDVTWDRHYHVTLLSDARLRDLLAELDLERAIRWVETKTGFFVDGRLYSLSNSWEFLRFPPLGWVDKARLAITILYAARLRDGRRLAQVPVVEWLRRWSGRRTTERIWLPLLRAKLGENHRQASAAFIWAIIRRMYAARRTGLKKEMFGYVPGGYARILERFSDHLRTNGVHLRLGARVASVRRQRNGHRVTSVEGGHDDFDRVVVTTPCPVIQRICSDLAPAEKESLERVRYQGVLCASLLLRKPLAGYYVTNVTDSWVPFTAVIEMTALVQPEELGGRHLVYLPKYLPADDPWWETPDETIQESFLGALERMYPGFHRGDVAAFRVSRVRHVLAVTTVGYQTPMPTFATSIPGLYVVNSAQIVNGTLNVNETVQLAERAVPALVAHAPALEASRLALQEIAT